MPTIVPVTLTSAVGVSIPSVESAAELTRDVAGAVAASAVLSGQPWAPVAAALSLVGIAGKRILVPALEWLANDPPDPMYAIPVHMKRSHLTAREIPLEGAPTARDAVRAFDDIDSAAAAIRALVRAAEREQAAVADRAHALAAERMRDRIVFQGEASAALSAARDSLRTVAKACRGAAAAHGAPPTVEERESALRMLESARVPTSERRIAAEDDPQTVVSAADALETAAADSGELAEVVVRDWDRAMTDDDL